MTHCLTRDFFIGMQPGVEAYVEHEIQRQDALALHPHWTVTQALPGWRIFRFSGELGASSDSFHTLSGASSPSIFAKTWGQVLSADETPWCQPSTRSAFEMPFVLQVWSRREFLPGAREKRPILLDVELRERSLREQLTQAQLPLLEARLPEIIGQRVVNCIRVTPKQWLWAVHTHSEDRIAHAGGEFPWPPQDIPSRAYVKCQEALTWSGAPLRAGEHAIELGCAPGGSLLALLEKGLHLTGVDPADIQPEIIERARALGLHLELHKMLAEKLEPSRLAAQVDWLFSDMNVEPQSLLALLEGWRPHLRSRGLRGLFLTLKLTDPAFIPQLKTVAEDLRSRWEFRIARLRQLSQNRREIFLYLGR